MIKWIALQPLIGGMAIAAKNIFESLPLEVYSDTFGNTSHLEEYWKNVKFSQLSEYDGKQADVVIAVPFCSGLSMANTCTDGEKARGADAIQNDNMYNLTEMALSQIKPKAFIFENAPNLATGVGKKVVEKLYDKAIANGYSLTIVKTSSMLHGLPQNRKRTFAIFWKSKTVPNMNFYNRKPLSVSEYLSKIPNDAKDQDVFSRTNLLEEDATFLFLRSKEKDNFRAVLEKYRTVANYIDRCDLWDEADKFFEENNFLKDQKLYKHYRYKRSIEKGYWDSSLQYTGEEYIPALIGKNMGKLLHPTEDRYYSVREQEWFMGLPHDFNLINPQQNNIHITQNVPVPTAEDWMREIKKFVNGELTFSNSTCVIHDNYSQKVVSLYETSIFEGFK